MTESVYGQAPSGEAVTLYELTNSDGLVIRVMDWGATVTSMVVPDREGNLEEVTLGFDDLADWIADSSYKGVVVGRYGNRIGDAEFTIDGKTYELTANNNDNTLHGGPAGFHKHLWSSQSFEEPGKVGVVMTRTSPDGEEGYPGELDTTIRFSLNDKNEFAIEYKATTDQATHVNLTHHMYYNLSGHRERDILGHELMIDADKFTPVDDELIPTGELAAVENTPMDFREPTEIGVRINADYDQLKFGQGYDHNWVLNDWDGSLKLQASLYDPVSGRLMEILTEEPGLQFYSGNFMDGTSILRGGQRGEFRHGLCLETQHFPDTPNKPRFPSTLLRPGETYETKTVFRFSTR